MNLVYPRLSHTTSQRGVGCQESEYQGKASGKDLFIPRPSQIKIKTRSKSSFLTPLISVQGYYCKMCLFNQGIPMSEFVISGTGLFTPPETLSNKELVEAFNCYVDEFNQENDAEIKRGNIEALEKSSEAFIEKASGIKSRFCMNKSGIVDPKRMKPYLKERTDEEHSIQCEMSIHAAKEAITNAKITPDHIGMVIVACSNLQRAYPAVAIEVQQALGIHKAFAFDMNVACSSATFALQMAHGALTSGSVSHCLIVNPEICTAHLNFKSRDCHFIFGDACTAMIVQKKKSTKSSKTLSGS